MADVKISDLTAATVVIDTDEVELNASGNARRADVSLIRRSYEAVDISGADRTSAVVPTASTATGMEITLAWSGGDGTYTAEFDTAENLYMPDGTALTATQIAGEGDGFATIKCDGTKWNVLEYRDKLSIADTGNWSVCSKTKHLQGLSFRGQIDRTENMQTASGNLFTTSGTLTDAWPITISTLNISGVTATGGAFGSLIVAIDASSTTASNFVYRPARGSSTASVPITILVTVSDSEWY